MTKDRCVERITEDMRTKDELIFKVMEHIRAVNPLVKNDIHLLISRFPEYYYRGEAYRVLFFNEPCPIPSIEQDISFSQEIKQAYPFYQMYSEKKFVLVYLVEISGFNLFQFFCNNTDTDILEFFSQYNKIISDEREILCEGVTNSSIIFKGSYLEFTTFIENL